MPVLRPQMALNGIEVCMRTAGTLSARSFVMCFVAKEVVAASEEDSQILKLEENAVGLNERSCTICGQRRDAGSMTRPHSTQIIQKTKNLL